MGGAAERSSRQGGPIAVGRIRRAHGVHGYVRFESLSGEVNHFSSMCEVELRDREQAMRHYKVEAFRLAAPTLLMKLEGVDDREAAAKLSGQEILVDRRYAAPLGPNEYYLADLEGCRVQLDGQMIGTVRAVLEAGAGDILEVVVVEGRTVMIPFRRQYVLSADVKVGVIELVNNEVLE